MPFSTPNVDHNDHASKQLARSNHHACLSDTATDYIYHSGELASRFREHHVQVITHLLRESMKMIVVIDFTFVAFTYLKPSTYVSATKQHEDCLGTLLKCMNDCWMSRLLPSDSIDKSI